MKEREITYDLEQNLNISLKSRFSEFVLSPDKTTLPAVLNIRTEPMEA